MAQDPRKKTVPPKSTPGYRTNAKPVPIPTVKMTPGKILEVASKWVFDNRDTLLAYMKKLPTPDESDISKIRHKLAYAAVMNNGGDSLPTSVIPVAISCCAGICPRLLNGRDVESEMSSDFDRFSTILDRMDGEGGGADSMAGDPRRSGRRSQTQINAGVRQAGRVRADADRSRRGAEARFKHSKPAFAAAQGAILPYVIIPRGFDIDAAIAHKIAQYASSALGQAIIGAIKKGSDPRKAIAAQVVAAALTRLNAEVGGKIPTAAIPLIAGATAELIMRNDVVSTIIALGAVVNLAREVEGGQRALPPAREADGETGWDVALRRLGSGASPASPRPAPSRSPAGTVATAAQASAARKRIRAAVAPAFATALDTAVNPDLILRLAARGTGGRPDLAAMRHGYVVTAARHFAAEFVRTIGSAPKGTSEQLALGAIIAAALAQTGQAYPIVPPPAVPAMSVLIHKTLQPQLPGLARMAAAIAAAPPGASVAAQPMREMAW